MKHIFKSLNILFAIVVIISVSSGQGFPVKGRSSLELNIGFWGGTKISNTLGTAGIQSEAKTSGFLGSVLYSHWIQEQICITLSAGVLAAEASSSISIFGVSQNSSAVIPLLIGVNYYLFNPDPEDAVRPFLSAAIGTYIGSETNSTTFSQETHTETASGGRFGAGIDFMLNNNFNLGINIRYNIMSDFRTPVGARNNYNSVDVSIGIGYLF